MNILLTGFEPFGVHAINPSQLLVESLPDQYQGITLTKSILPVDHQLTPKVLINLLRDHQPDAVISFGLASGRAKIAIERVAVNLMDFSIPDNTGATIENHPVVEQGPAAYFSSLPIHAMQSALNKAGIPAELSLTAGAYLCNQVFYLLMHQIAIQNLKAQAGFIHLPALPEQAASSKKTIPSMSLEHIRKAAFLIVAELDQDHSSKQTTSQNNH